MSDYGLDMSDIVNQLRIKAGVMEMGERIAWGSDTELMREAADEIERLRTQQQGEAVCETESRWGDLGELSGAEFDAFVDEAMLKAAQEGE